jgi:hypothetical protein
MTAQGPKTVAAQAKSRARTTASRSGGGPLRILIVSTPKTGNTWVKHLLSAAYRLPIEELGPEFDEYESNGLGDRWIAHQHYQPDTRLLDWARRRDVIFVTTLRHPADTFVSLYHYARNFARPGWQGPLVRLSQADTFDCRQASTYLIEEFHRDLSISEAWLATNRSHLVRYEDLCNDPESTFKALTDQIFAVDDDVVRRAVDRCCLEALRATSSDTKFFRRGGAGHWSQELPHQVVSLFRHMPPYPDLFARLGYDLKAEVPAGAGAGRPVHSVHEIESFDNGVAFRPVFADLYLALESSRTARWPSPATTGGGDTFFAWLNRRAEDDPAPTAEPLVTNLAVHIHFCRRDLRSAFPDMFGEDRRCFVEWFLKFAATEYALDPVFVRPVAESVRKVGASIPA